MRSSSRPLATGRPAPPVEVGRRPLKGRALRPLVMDGGLSPSLGTRPAAAQRFSDTAVWRPRGHTVSARPQFLAAARRQDAITKTAGPACRLTPPLASVEQLSASPRPPRHAIISKTEATLRQRINSHFTT